MFATDRDLLALEPRLFFDIAWTAQKLVEGAGASINSAGDTLTLSGADFESLGVEAGFVAIVGQAPYEVIGRLSPTSLRISRLRADAHHPLIPGAAATGASLLISTFRPQIGIVHGQLLRALGIEPGAAETPTESDITNPRALALAEALGALHLIFASAAALVSFDSPLWTKARLYRERYAAERQRVAALVDLNGDGAPDVTRRPNVIQFLRA
jgi:hypothetical protein